MPTPLRLRLLLCGALLLAIAPPPLAAQSEPRRVQRFTTEHGLAGNRVMSVAEDRLGFLWVGTSGGLQRFDGHTFLSHRSPTPEGRPPPRAVPLHATPEGHLWLASPSTLVRLDPASHETVPYPVAGQAIGLLPAAGSLWLADRRSFRRLASDGPPAAAEERLTVGGDQRIEALGRGEGARLWLAIADADGAWLLAHDTRTGETSRFERLPSGSIAGPVLAVREDGEGRVWVGGERGLGWLDPPTGRFTPLPEFRHERVTDLEADAEDRLWALTARAIARLQGGAAVERHRIVDGHSLTGLYLDRQGTFWISSLAHGLLRLDPREPPFVHAARTGPRPLPLSSDFVLGLRETSDGALWVGTLGNGLNRVAPDGRTVTSWGQDLAPPHHLPVAHVWTVLEDRRGRLWIGTDAGLCRQEDDSERFRCRDVGRPGASLGAIAEDAAGRLWLGHYPAGLVRFDPDREEVSILPGSEYAVISLGADESGRLWIGTLDKGLRWLDVTRPEPGPPEAFEGVPRDADVYAIHQDRGGGLWAGTSAGLIRLEPLPPAVQPLGSEERPGGVIVFSITSDEFDDLWLGTAHGLVRFTPSTGAMRRFGRRDGVGGAEFNRSAVVHLRSGALAFGGVEGITEVHPERLRGSEAPAPVLFSRFQIMGREGVRAGVLYGERRIVLHPATGPSPSSSHRSTSGMRSSAGTGTASRTTIRIGSRPDRSGGPRTRDCARARTGSGCRAQGATARGAGVRGWRSRWSPHSGARPGSGPSASPPPPGRSSSATASA